MGITDTDTDTITITPITAHGTLHTTITIPLQLPHWHHHEGRLTVRDRTTMRPAREAQVRQGQQATMPQVPQGVQLA